MWPDDIFTPRDSNELITATMAVHEGAHAAVAVGNFLTVAGIVIAGPEGIAGPAGNDLTVGGRTRFTGMESHVRGWPGIVTAMAARPAVHRYLRCVGASLIGDLAAWTAVLEPSFTADDADVARYGAGEYGAALNLAWCQEIADRLVEEHWDRVVAVAQALTTAQGHLSGDDPALLAALAQ